jgi:putative tryptophan/tyrosine transport system substrate-binding protein
MLKVFFLSLLILLIAVSRQLAEAYQAEKVPRIGILSPSSSAVPALDVYDSFRQGLRELGYIEGKDIFIETRYAEGKLDQLSDFATELVKLKVDVIVTSTTPGVLAAKNATSAIPIVFWSVGDPVGAGLVSSLARPGGNITGLSMLSPELGGKRLELLKEAFPKITKVTYLRNPDFPGPALTAMREAAQALGLYLQSLDVRSAKDFDGAFEAVLKERAQALTAASVPVISSNQQRIVAFAAKNRLPAIYPRREFIDAGGLMFYGVSSSDMVRRAATYVDKILKGTAPANLPIEQPRKFELVINLKTARALGLKIPAHLLMEADRVIEESAGIKPAWSSG